MSSLTVRVPGHDYDPYGQNMLVPRHSNRPYGQLNTSTMLGRALILTAEVMGVQICRLLDIRMANNLLLLDISDCGHRRIGLNRMRVLWCQNMVTLTSSCRIPAVGDDSFDRVTEDAKMSGRARWH